MVRTPEYPLGPVFEKARDWAAQQELSLTEGQRRSYEDLKAKQAIERRQQQERLDAFRNQLEEQAKKKKLKPELALNPPMRVKDPYIERQMQNILAAESRLEGLDQNHAQEQIKALQNFEQERERQKSLPAKDRADSWKDALQKTARQENDRSDRRDLGKDFDKAR